jgi:uncharacterized protein
MDQNVADTQWQAGIESFRALRMRELSGEWGWLTLAGLFWLQEGQSSCGGAGSDIELAKVTGLLGNFSLNAGQVHFSAAITGLIYNGQELGPDDLQQLPMGSDRDGHKPDELRWGDYNLTVIWRSQALAVRLRDRQSPTRLQFPGLTYFPLADNWRITAEYLPFSEPRQQAARTALGLEEAEIYHGELVFSLGGQEYRLWVQNRGKHLHAAFKDLTNGKETYGACRFVHCPLPVGAEGGLTVLDFNLAYHPVCAFTPYATCSMPLPQNRLNLAVPAGERL